MKKKYLIFSTDFKPHKGGIAEFVYNIANYLKKEDLINEIITYTPQENEKFDYPVRITNILNRKRKLGERLGDSFFLTRKLNTLIHKIFLHYLSYKDLKPILKNKAQIKVLVCSYYTYDNGIFINMCRILNIEYEILYHGLDVLLISKMLTKQFLKNSKHANRLIFNSKASRNLFIEKSNNLFVPTEVIYPLIDTKTILETETYSKDELETKWNINLANKHIISCVAALGKRKGVAIGVAAMAKLVEKYPDYIFIIGGKGPEKVNLIKQVKELKLENNVFILGLISDKEKWSLLKYSEIFVLPSSGLKGVEWEGFGISYIEASLFENIVIGGDHGGIVEAIDDKKSGFLIKFDTEDNVEKLHIKLEEIIENDNKKISEYGRKYVIDNFDVDNFKGRF
ncbi:MAG: glycosyltransferase family 4 protein [Bacteroidales bacterium]|nr:glycosyltransferase family 4 protein [Bacteroidales bacterium]